MKPLNHPIACKSLFIVALMLTACGSGSPVAVVNGSEISRTTYEANIEQVEQNAKTQGIDTENKEFQDEIQKNVLDKIIGTELLLQAAQQSGAVLITDEKVNGEYIRIELENGGKDALLAQLKQLDISEDDLREDIRKQFLIQGYITAYLSDKDVSVSDEEVQELYNQVASQQADLPPLEEVADQVRQQIVQQKNEQLIADHVSQLRQNANVEILISN